jgi:glutamate/tyrosine decarboxylase-like PLP-dependent enzyme
MDHNIQSQSIDTDLQLLHAIFFLLSLTQSKGLQNLPRLVLFTSADAHYSVKKLASFMGLGTDNVYLINTDDVGKLDANHLGNLYDTKIF